MRHHYTMSGTGQKSTDREYPVPQLNRPSARIRMANSAQRERHNWCAAGGNGAADANNTAGANDTAGANGHGWRERA
ncbi:hypothetical protein ACE6ED_17155 [Paenibacillus sp. CN-4]|uniref:hypothetical protein n=1 Tax=Paenibacillus nanchangensis TaxID=3348343 RepID=UPI00397CB007